MSFQGKSEDIGGIRGVGGAEEQVWDTGGFQFFGYLVEVYCFRGSQVWVNVYFSFRLVGVLDEFFNRFEVYFMDYDMWMMIKLILEGCYQDLIGRSKLFSLFVLYLIFSYFGYLLLGVFYFFF